MARGDRPSALAGSAGAPVIEDVVPDIVTLGKALGGGLPLSGAIGPTSALDTPSASALMTTIGNPVSCAAGLAVLDIRRDGALAHAA